MARLARSLPTFQVLGGAKNVRKRELGSSGPRQMDGGDAPSQELAELPLVKLGQVLLRVEGCFGCSGVAG